ncbi:MAG: hypothetical protein WC423_24870 [Vulcanimicrobiota bacterium]
MNSSLTRLVEAAKRVVGSYDMEAEQATKTDLAEAMQNLLQQAEEVEAEQATIGQIAAARKLYQTDDVEIDEDARVSEDIDGTGYWVSAWVWIGEDD